MITILLGCLNPARLALASCQGKSLGRWELAERASQLWELKGFCGGSLEVS